jgi:hypothetical protein
MEFPNEEKKQKETFRNVAAAEIPAHCGGNSSAQ